MSAELNFNTLQRQEIPVTIDGKKYTLREASLKTGIKYRDTRLQASIIKNGEVVGTKGTSFVVPLILSDCLFDEDGKNVPKDTIELWPDRITSKIWDK